MKSSKPNQSTLTMIYNLIFLMAIVISAWLLYITYDPTARLKPFFARSINDATYNCEDRINDRFKDDLISKNFDNLSSRYNADNRQYAIFYRITVREHKRDFSILKDYMVKCTVWETLGYVSEFTVFDF